MFITGKPYSENYYEQIRIFGSPLARALLACLAVLLVALPHLGGPYAIYIMNMAFISLVGALGLNILTGYTGQISLGHSAFVAIGAYGAAILAKRFALPFWLIVPASGALAAMAGIAVGLPCLRLKGLYLAMATMAFGIVVEHLVVSWESLTGGVRGIQMAAPNFLGKPLSSDTQMYFFLLAVAALMLILANNMLRTRIGRAFIAIRDREVAAEAIGVNLTLYKVMAFAISSFYAGVAGGLYAYTLGYLQPDHFTFLLSVQYIAMNIVGGLGSVLGSVLGSLFLVIMPELIKVASGWLESVVPSLQGKYNQEWDIALFGLIIILFLVLEPGGLNAIWVRARRAVAAWPYS